MAAMKLKICGLTSPAQAAAVAEMGVDALGVIAASNSARFLPAAKRLELWGAVATANPSVLRVLVLVNPSNDQLDELRPEAGHQCLQLHGDESVERCAELQNELKLPIWKALRLRSSADLNQIGAYANVVEKILLEPHVPDQYGGTGHSLPLNWLAGFKPPCPWWLAGGMGASNVENALKDLEGIGSKPYGIDASSSVENSPGNKNIEKVKILLDIIKKLA